MIIFKILLYIILFLIALILLILVLPVFYTASGQKLDTAFLKAEVSGPLEWFYFIFRMDALDKREMHLKLFGINVAINGRKACSEEHKEEKKKDKKKKTKKHEKGLIRKVFKAAGDSWQHIKPRLLDVEGRYGFEDPYYTGLASAAVNSTAPHGGRYNINLTPVFDAEVIEGRFKIEGRIVPAVLIWIFVKVFVLPHVKNKIPFINNRRVS